MDGQDEAVLDRLQAAVGDIRVHRDRMGRPSRKKPLLLLLVLSRLEHGNLSENIIHFDGIADDLRALIRRFGERGTRGNASPDQPFVYLKTAPFWKLHFPPGASKQTRDQRKRSMLSNPETFASLEGEAHALLARSREARLRLAEVILERWWEEPQRSELARHLALTR